MKFIKHLLTAELPLGYSILLNCFLCAGMMCSMLGAMCDSDSWNEDRLSTVIEKEMFTKTGSKGRVYDDSFLKVRWDDTREEEWIHSRTIDYLNTEVGDRHIDRVQKGGFPYFIRRFIGIGMTLIFLVWWSYRLAIKMPI